MRFALRAPEFSPRARERGTPRFAIVSKAGNLAGISTPTFTRSSGRNRATTNWHCGKFTCTPPGGQRSVDMAGRSAETWPNDDDHDACRPAIIVYMFAIAARHALARLEQRARRALARVEPVHGRHRRCPVFVFDDAQIIFGRCFQQRGHPSGQECEMTRSTYYEASFFFHSLAQHIIHTRLTIHSSRQVAIIYTDSASLNGYRRVRLITRQVFFSFYNTHTHRHSLPSLLACFALAFVDDAAEAASILTLTLTVPVRHPLFVQRIVFEVEAAIVRGSSRARMF